MCWLSCNRFLSEETTGTSPKFLSRQRLPFTITLHKNKKIAILALTPTLNLTETLTLGLTLMLILIQTQKLIQTLTII